MDAAYDRPSSELDRRADFLTTVARSEAIVSHDQARRALAQYAG
jgi:hypothetical protein